LDFPQDQLCFVLADSCVAHELIDGGYGLLQLCCHTAARLVVAVTRMVVSGLSESEEDGIDQDGVDSKSKSEGRVGILQALGKRLGIEGKPNGPHTSYIEDSPDTVFLRDITSEEHEAAFGVLESVISWSGKNTDWQCRLQPHILPVFRRFFKGKRQLFVPPSDKLVKIDKMLFHLDAAIDSKPELVDKDAAETSANSETQNQRDFAFLKDVQTAINDEIIPRGQHVVSECARVLEAEKLLKKKAGGDEGDAGKLGNHNEFNCVKVGKLKT
jgi:galactokinase